MTDIRKHIGHNYNVICDVCGRKRKRSECIMAYGSGTIPVVMSCRDGCADEEHTLNYPPPVIFDGRPVPDARPDVVASTTSPNIYINTGQFSIVRTWGHFPGQLYGQFPLSPSDPNSSDQLSTYSLWGSIIWT